MIDILYNKLGASNNASIAEWKDIHPDIFNRHSQHSLHSRHNLKECLIDIEDVVQVCTIPVQSAELSCDQSAPSTILAKNKRKEGNETNIANVANVAKVTKITKVTKVTKVTNDITNKPLNIIINETTSFHNSTEYIKEALITMISKEEFTKVFGLTKCAEIMSGVVNNRWNKSTALFISFLLDKEVYYNEKAVIYNKEKNNGRITITKT